MRCLTTGITALRIAAITLYMTLVIIAPAAAQTVARPYEVFLIPSQTDRDRLIFIDVIAGNETRIALEGERYTVLNGAVMYVERATGRVMLAFPDGRLTTHPVIQLDSIPGARRLDWIVSPDLSMIAWTLTSGSPDAITTVTRVARLEGANVINVREPLVDAPRVGVRVLPVAFSADKNTLYMDYQPDLIGAVAPLRQYAALFALDLTTGAVRALPGEPGCFCGAGFSAERFARVGLAGGGFVLRLYDLQANVNEPRATFAPIVSSEYTQTGDVLIAPDGARAVYTLAQVRGLGTSAQSVRAVYVLVDLLTGAQQVVDAPAAVADRPLRPVRWSDDDAAVLFIDPQAGSTWKLDLDGNFRIVASALYLGDMLHVII